MNIRVIARVAMILRSLEGETVGLSVSQIAQRSSLPRSTVQRIVEALRVEQLVMPASLTSRVRLGPALARLGASARVEFDQVALPIITALARELGETVEISILSGNSAVLTDQVQSSHRLRAAYAIGEAYPAHCTANGKALLSVLPASRLKQIIHGTLVRFAPNTITEPERLFAQIETCRRTGIAVENEEHTLGISALGTGFLDSSGRAISISVPMPTTRFKTIDASYSGHLLAARDRIVAALGASVHKNAAPQGHVGEVDLAWGGTQSSQSVSGNPYAGKKFL